MASDIQLITILVPSGLDKGCSFCPSECVSELQKCISLFFNFWYLPLLDSFSSVLHSTSYYGTPVQIQLLLAEFANILESELLGPPNTGLNFCFLFSLLPLDVLQE